jgi:hypothetical protein
MLESSLERAYARGHIGVVRQTQRKLDSYSAELRQRRDAGLNPGTEIQESHIK